MIIKFHIRANNDQKSQKFNFHTRLTSIKERHNQNTYNGLEFSNFSTSDQK